MNQPVKAALLSALIFPGTGQIFTGHKKKGWSFVLVMLALLALMITKLVQQASMVLDEMQKKGTPLDIEEISKLSSELVSFSDNMFLNITLLLLILIWFAAIVDAYRTGKSPA